MSGWITTYSLDVSNNALPINRRNPLFNDVWGRCCNSYGNWLPNAENKCIHFRQQWWAARKEFRFDWRTKRECHGPTGLLPTQAQIRLWYQCKAKVVIPKRFSIEKSFGNYQESSLGKIRVQLGKTISHHVGGKNKCVPFGGFRWGNCTPSLKCKQSKKVLLLIKTVLFSSFLIHPNYVSCVSPSIEVLNRN